MKVLLVQYGSWYKFAVVVICFRSCMVVLFQHFIACGTATTAAVEGKMSKSLKKLLKKLVVGEAQEQLAVADAKLGNVIKVVINLL